MSIMQHCRLVGAVDTLAPVNDSPLSIHLFAVIPPVFLSLSHKTNTKML